MQARVAPRDAFSGQRGMRVNRLADIDGVRAHFTHGVMGSRAVFNLRRRLRPICSRFKVTQAIIAPFLNTSPHHQANWSVVFNIRTVLL